MGTKALSVKQSISIWSPNLLNVCKTMWSHDENYLNYLNMNNHLMFEWIQCKYGIVSFVIYTYIMSYQIISNLKIWCNFFQLLNF
jgi:hypothetical protein